MLDSTILCSIILLLEAPETFVEKRFVESIMDYQPCLNSSGDWVLNEFDVECLTLGTGLLGCGGGGSPAIGRIELLNCIREGYKPRVVNSKRLHTTIIAYVQNLELVE